MAFIAIATGAGVALLMMGGSVIGIVLLVLAVPPCLLTFRRRRA
ncbi:hypothetical protein [Nonomuraea diastatica]|nr:hypothetical protein [Nonomuraea diastatica]